MIETQMTVFTGVRIICPEARQSKSGRLSKRALYYTVVGALYINTHTDTHTYRANRKTLMMSTDKHLTDDNPARHTQTHAQCTGRKYRQ